jgi:hypothetical protein
MKRSLLFLSLLMITHINFSQTSVEALKKELSKTKSENQKLKDENNFLNEKINFCQALKNDSIEIKPFDSNYDIKVLACIGDRKSQTVKIELILTHKMVNQNFCFQDNTSQAIDNIGNPYSISGLNEKFMQISTDTPVKLTYIVKSILPGTEMFKNVILTMDSRTQTCWGEYHITEIKNLKITW